MTQDEFRQLLKEKIREADEKPESIFRDRQIFRMARGALHLNKPIRYDERADESITPQTKIEIPNDGYVRAVDMEPPDEEWLAQFWAGNPNSDLAEALQELEKVRPMIEHAHFLLAYLTAMNDIPRRRFSTILCYPENFTWHKYWKSSDPEHMRQVFEVMVYLQPYSFIDISNATVREKQRLELAQERSALEQLQKLLLGQLKTAKYRLLTGLEQQRRQAVKALEESLGVEAEEEEGEVPTNTAVTQKKHTRRTKWYNAKLRYREDLEEYGNVGKNKPEQWAKDWCRENRHNVKEAPKLAEVLRKEHREWVALNPHRK